MEGAVVDSVSLDGILSNEQGNYIDLIFRLCLSVSLKDIVGVFFKRCHILCKTPFNIAYWRGGVADGVNSSPL